MQGLEREYAETHVDRTEHNNTTLLSRSLLQPRIPEISRFNPYFAEVGDPDPDPVRARVLLQEDGYRVVWLHIQPKCAFAFRVRFPTTVYMNPLASSSSAFYQIGRY